MPILYSSYYTTPCKLCKLLFIYLFFWIYNHGQSYPGVTNMSSAINIFVVWLDHVAYHSSLLQLVALSLKIVLGY